MNSVHDHRNQRSLWFYVVAIAVSCALFVFLVWSLRELILPIILAILLAYLFRPLMNSFKVSWLPDWLRLTFICSIILGSLTGIVYQVRNTIPDERMRLVLMVRAKYKLNERYEKLMGIDWATGRGNMLHDMFKTELDPLILKLNSNLAFTPEHDKQFRSYADGRGGLFQKIDDRYVQYHIKNLAHVRYGRAFDEVSAEADAKNHDEHSAGGGIHVYMGLIERWIVLPLVFLFLLFDNGLILKSFIRWIPNRYFEVSLVVLDEVDQALGKYFRGTFLECTLVGASIGIGMWMVGIDLKGSFIIGLLAGVSSAIPFLGTVVGLIAGIAYGLIAEDITPLFPFINEGNVMLAIVGVVVVAHVLDNVLFQPLVLGGAVDLHPIAVVVGAVGGSMMFGFSGMLLAIPTIVICSVVVEHLLKQLHAYRII